MGCSRTKRHRRLIGWQGCLRAMTAPHLHTLRASILRRIESRQGRSGIIALRQRLYAVTHEILARGGR